MLFLTVTLLVTLPFKSGGLILHKVRLGEHPYMAAICNSFYTDPESIWTLDRMVCQGTLVSSNWVLTAARCNRELVTRPLVATEYDALIGFLSNNDIMKGRRRRIIDWIPFGRASEVSTFIINDITLCKLGRDFDVIPIKLPPITWQDGQMAEPPDELLQGCYYVGWRDKKRLISAKVRVLGILEFYNQTKLLGVSANLYVEQPSYVDGVVGGALICNGMQEGVYLSFSEDIGVYTKIAKYLMWMESTLNLDEYIKKLKISSEIFDNEELQLVNERQKQRNRVHKYLPEFELSSKKTLEADEYENYTQEIITFASKSKQILSVGFKITIPTLLLLRL